MAGFGFPCPSCNRKLKASLEMVGKRGKCPSCGHAVKIPAPDLTRTPVNASLNKSQRKTPGTNCGSNVPRDSELVEKRALSLPGLAVGFCVLMAGIFGVIGGLVIDSDSAILEAASLSLLIVGLVIVVGCLAKRTVTVPMFQMHFMTKNIRSYIPKIQLELWNILGMLLAIAMIISVFLPWYHMGLSHYTPAGWVTITDVVETGNEELGILGTALPVGCFILVLFKKKWATIPGVLNIILAAGVYKMDRGLWRVESFNIGFYLFIITSSIFIATTSPYWFRGPISQRNGKAVEGNH